MKSKIVFCTVLLVVMSLACRQNVQNDSRVDTLPFYSEASFTPYWKIPNDTSLKTFHRISPFKLINQDGNEITNTTFKDKVYVVNFFFTACPGICPRMINNMMTVQEKFRDDPDVLLLSHSVTPKRDSVLVLKQYAESNGIISGKWHLVTGNQKEIYKLGRMDYFVEEDLGLNKEEDDFLHTENLVLIDGNGHIRGIYNGLRKTSVSQLTADIETLKKEIK